MIMCESQTVVYLGFIPRLGTSWARRIEIQSSEDRRRCINLHPLVPNSVHSMGSGSVIIVSALFALGLPLVLL